VIEIGSGDPSFYPFTYRAFIIPPSLNDPTYPGLHSTNTFIPTLPHFYLLPFPSLPSTHTIIFPHNTSLHTYLPFTSPSHHIHSIIPPTIPNPLTHRSLFIIPPSLFTNIPILFFQLSISHTLSHHFPFINFRTNLMNIERLICYRGKKYTRKKGNNWCHSSVG